MRVGYKNINKDHWQHHQTKDVVPKKRLTKSDTSLCVLVSTQDTYYISKKCTDEKAEYISMA